jgi:Tfp pilus assembly protein PilE
MKKSKIQNQKLLKQNSGFVILFTVLIASIILAIALGIASVSYREVLLSSTANDAEFSFFAADTGAECALYWDIQQSAFGATLVTPSCGGAAVDMTSSSSPFKFRFATSTTGCASVTVDKSDPTTTKIESLGYNATCNEVLTNPTNPRIVERAIRVTYGPGEPPDANANTAVNTASQGPNTATTLETPTTALSHGPAESLQNPTPSPESTLETSSVTNEAAATRETEQVEPVSPQTTRTP